MLNIYQSKESTTTRRNINTALESKPEVSVSEDSGDDDKKPKPTISETTNNKKTISVGDSLPYGIRLYYGSHENIVRMKDIGNKKRILILGVIGSFTPYCWNRHLFRVIQKIGYYEERDIDYICCISTNDAHTQRAWGSYLGCEETVLMLADPSCRFTKELGLDVVIPWLDNKIRSKRYIIYAEDMTVLKMVVATKDEPTLKWECKHLRQNKELEDEDLTSETDIWTIT